MIKMRPWEKSNPVFLVWQPDASETEDDAREVEASDAEQAAEDFAEWDDCNSAEYLIANGNEATVHVRRKGDDSAPVERFIVRGEVVPQYSAKALP